MTHVLERWSPAAQLDRQATIERTAAMTDDEAAIRQVVERWHAATRAGDVATVLSLMTDDVVFQVPGRPPFGKAEFESMSRTATGGAPPKISFDQRVDELKIVGDFAYLRSSLRVKVEPPVGEAIERVGTTLTIFRRESGRWLLARDANLLAKVQE
jgi:uncharacterized protein (TIGR02246 family)